MPEPGADAHAENKCQTVVAGGSLAECREHGQTNPTDRGISGALAPALRAALRSV